jgi:hypothetical protein
VIVLVVVIALILVSILLSPASCAKRSLSIFFSRACLADVRSARAAAGRTGKSVSLSILQIAAYGIVDPCLLARHRTFSRHQSFAYAKNIAYAFAVLLVVVNGFLTFSITRPQQRSQPSRRRIAAALIS